MILKDDNISSQMSSYSESIPCHGVIMWNQNIGDLVEIRVRKPLMENKPCCSLGPLLLTWFNLIPALKMWDEITYPFLNFNGGMDK